MEKKRKLRVAILGDVFHTWGGGVDFIATIAEALENMENVEVYLALPKDSLLLYNIKKVYKFFKYKMNWNNYREWKKVYDKQFDMIINVFNECCPKTKVIRYMSHKINDETGLSNKLEEEKIDICFPSGKTLSGNVEKPWVGYVYDFQHKKLPELFTSDEIEHRDRDFERRVMRSKYVVVNSKEVKNDIEKYYPNHKCEIMVLPFLPFQMPVLEGDYRQIKDKYQLPERYYMISNQFWKHKNHITAFAAFESMYLAGGYEDIHLVCTGKIEDNRDPEYGAYIREYISGLKCKNNIHILGYIPKTDQIQILRNSIALIQPTLCEGGPGGGAVYNALCLGIPCIVSDIEVNKEITGYENVYFFEAQNAEALFKEMVKHLEDKKIDFMKVKEKNEINKKKYGEFLCQELITMLSRNV